MLANSPLLYPASLSLSLLLSYSQCQPPNTHVQTISVCTFWSFVIFSYFCIFSFSPFCNSTHPSQSILDFNPKIDSSIKQNSWYPHPIVPSITHCGLSLHSTLHLGLPQIYLNVSTLFSSSPSRLTSESWSVFYSVSGYLSILPTFTLGTDHQKALLQGALLFYPKSQHIRYQIERVRV